MDIAPHPVYQYSTVTAGAQLRQIEELLHSQAPATTGLQLLAELEHTAADRVGRAAAIAVSSATAGLELALRTLEVGTGDEVVIPELGWVSVGAAVAATGATVRVAPVTAGLSPTWPQIEPLITDATTAVVLAHLRGRAAGDTAGIADQLRQRGIPLIEDCAQAWGAQLADGRPAGAVGTAAVFSTQTYKLIAAGEGGILTADEPDLIASARALSGDTRARTLRPTWRGNTRMNPIAAACALPQLAHLDAILAQLRPLQRRLIDDLRRIPGIDAVQPENESAGASNGSLIGLWMSTPDKAARVAERLSAAGLRIWRPSHGDLHHAAAWPARPDQPIVDVQRYLDLQIPLLPPTDHDPFCDQVVQTLNRAQHNGPPNRETDDDHR